MLQDVMNINKKKSQNRIKKVIPCENKTTFMCVKSFFLFQQ